MRLDSILPWKCNSCARSCYAFKNPNKCILNKYDKMTHWNEELEWQPER